MAPSPGRSSSPPPFGRLRLASPSDIPRIGIVAASGFPYSSVFDWERPYHAKFPHDTLLSYCHEFLSVIKSTEHIVLVATDKFDPNEGTKTKAIIPDDNGWPTPEPYDEVVVGVACWKLQPGSDRIGSFQNDDAPYPELMKNPMRDMDKGHCDELDERCEAAEEQYFQSLATMEMVVVHPAYWRRGHGGRLVRWGIDLAKVDNVCQGVIAAEMGKSLYLSLGYEELEDLHVGGDEGIHVSVMQYDVKSGSTLKRLLSRVTRLRRRIPMPASVVVPRLGQVCRRVRHFLCYGYSTRSFVEEEKEKEKDDINQDNFIYVSPSTPQPTQAAVAVSTPPPPSSPSLSTLSKETENYDTSSSNSSEVSLLSPAKSYDLVPRRRQISLPLPVGYFSHLSPLHMSGLQYFTERTVRALAPHPQIFDELCELILPMAVFNDALLQGIVALAAVHKLASCKTSDEQTAQGLIIEGFQALSSRSLCQRLSECDDDRQLVPLLAAARTLFVCEVFAANPSRDRWSIHFRGARGLISRLQDKGLSKNPTDELRFLLRWFDMTESLVCHAASDLVSEQTTIPTPSTQSSDSEPVYIDMYLARTRDLLGVFKEIARLQHRSNKTTDTEDAEVSWLLSYLEGIIDRDRANPPPVLSIRGRVFSPHEVNEYRLSNQVWQLTALLLIQRRLRHLPRSSSTIQDLVRRILEGAERMTLRDGLTPVTLLTPPLFFAGCDALGPHRERVQHLLHGVSKCLGLLNTQKALDILEDHWAVDDGHDDELADMSLPKISEFLPY
ncbi:hypothetical protein Neosp_013270 [[Neocosmospora] mangrovei]